MPSVLVWGADGQPVEVEVETPGEGEVWVWGENGEPVVVAQADVDDVDLDSPAEGNLWVWGENGEPVQVAEELVPVRLRTRRDEPRDDVSRDE